MTTFRQTPAAALALAQTVLHLAPGGAIRPLAWRPGLFAGLAGDPALQHGRVLALTRVDGPGDVHYPAWEMHPEGDELLLLLDGALAVELRDEEAAPPVPLRPLTAFIVPAGTWHRLVVHEPSALLSITPHRNTTHEKG